MKNGAILLSIVFALAAATALVCCKGSPSDTQVAAPATGQQRMVLMHWFQCEECSKAEARKYLTIVPASIVLASIETPLSQGPSEASRRRYEVALQVMHNKMKLYVERRGQDGPSLSDWPTYRDRWMQRFVAGYEIKACWMIEAYARELMGTNGTAVRRRLEAILRSKWGEAKDAAVRRALGEAAKAIDVKLESK